MSSIRFKELQAKGIPNERPQEDFGHKSAIQVLSYSRLDHCHPDLSSKKSTNHFELFSQQSLRDLNVQGLYDEGYNRTKSIIRITREVGTQAYPQYK